MERGDVYAIESSPTSAPRPQYRGSLDATTDKHRRELMVHRVLTGFLVCAVAGLIAGIVVISVQRDNAEQRAKDALAAMSTTQPTGSNATTTAPTTLTTTTTTSARVTDIPTASATPTAPTTTTTTTTTTPTTPTTPTSTTTTTSSASTGHKTNNVQPPDWSDPDVFQSFSQQEIESVRDFLLQQPKLKLTPAQQALVRDNYIFSIEYMVPAKTEVLAYLDERHSKPARWAEVIVFRGGDSPPIVQTLKVGPLPVVSRYEDLTDPRDAHKRFLSRPYDFPEYNELDDLYRREFSSTLYDIINDSFGVSPVWLSCKKRCFSLDETHARGAEKGTRLSWYEAVREIEAKYLFQMDFQVEVNHTDSDSKNWRINRVYYNGILFQSMSNLEQAYYSDPSVQMRDTTDHTSSNLFSTLPRREGRRASKRDRKPEPVQVSPEGNRFSVDGNHVTYMDWEFRFFPRTTSGMQLFDIRFDGERIAYEISMQELAASYSSSSPAHAGTTYFDSGLRLGMSTFPLVPGVDCPPSAVLLDVYHSYGAVPIVHAKNAVCLFEWNTLLPMKRHFANNNADGTYDFYGGQSDTVFVLRTIAVVYNYDYIIDYMFHLNGVVEVRTAATGYIWPTFYTSSGLRYGLQINDFLTGPLHVHLFHFKIDMDISGRNNCFETVDIVMDQDTAAPYDSTVKLPQMTFKRNLRHTEAEALIKYSFDDPKYFLFYNQDVTNPYGFPRSYRLHGAPYGKLLLPEDAGRDPGFSWARHQIAVTKYKETERRSSSIYTYNNFVDPIVNFTTFYADNEALEQQDLVAWVTLGFHHLPHTEDLPMTATVGTKAHFMLLPYNYFDADPSMVDSNIVFLRYNPETKKPDVTTYTDNVSSVCGADLRPYSDFDGLYYVDSSP